MDFFLVQRERDQLLQEKMEALRHLMVADRLVSLGMLAAGLSHHIRNALVTVKTFMDLAPGQDAGGEGRWGHRPRSRFLVGLPPERAVPD